ncbi:Mercuric transport protein, MerC [hydrothermal vent metagenome]|uniref:Mercuric transport protein, MerC n=1 Tax=hydrothermal vent metagenome TaxID=652676 RepID=A0A3B0WF40_9ZZZZ
MQWITRLFDKTGAIGVILAAMGCASCFPAFGALGASLGLGFLAHYEGVFINTLLPIFAWIGIASNVVLFLSHRVIYRLIAGITGPTMVLLTMGPLWTYDWSTYLLYTGIVIMMIVAIWDLVSPARKVCSSCEPTKA